jgi:hypothetical protein
MEMLLSHTVGHIIGRPPFAGLDDHEDSLIDQQHVTVHSRLT